MDLYLISNGEYNSDSTQLTTQSVIVVAGEHNIEKAVQYLSKVNCVPHDEVTVNPLDAPLSEYSVKAKDRHSDDEEERFMDHTEFARFHGRRR